MTLQEGLNRWSELEPEWCKVLRSREGLTVFDVQIATIEVFHGANPGEEEKLASIVQGAVQCAMENHNIGCILHRSGISDDWEAKVGAFLKYHEEPAIALLTAYVTWLEKNQEVSA